MPPASDPTWDWGEVIPAVIAVLALLAVAYLAVVEKSAGAEAGLLALLGAASGTYYRRPPRAGSDGNGNGNGYSNGNGAQPPRPPFSTREGGVRLVS